MKPTKEIYDAIYDILNLFLHDADWSNPTQNEVTQLQKFVKSDPESFGEYSDIYDKKDILEFVKDQNPMDGKWDLNDIGQSALEGGFRNRRFSNQKSDSVIRIRILNRLKKEDKEDKKFEIAFTFDKDNRLEYAVAICTYKKNKYNMFLDDDIAKKLWFQYSLY